jgi:hypothetical protein
MRATELLGATVYDSDGRAVGAVRDLRLAVGGEAVPDSGRPAYRLAALECGPVGVAHRLGYGRRPLNGPWPLTVLVRALIRHSVLVDWADVVSVRGNRIDIRRRRDELRSSVRDGAEPGRDGDS